MGNDYIITRQITVNITLILTVSWIVGNVVKTKQSEKKIQQNNDIMIIILRLKQTPSKFHFKIISNANGCHELIAYDIKDFQKIYFLHLYTIYSIHYFVFTVSKFHSI